MQSNQLLYLLYGDKVAYRHEAKFSILSALRQRTEPDSFSITVMTDQPAEFDGWPVEVVPLDAETLMAWLGGGDYVHRRKACAIQAGVRLAEKTIFIDTDTVFLKDPASLFERVSDDSFLVDECEMTWGEASPRPEYLAFAQELALAEKSPAPGLRLFNSGVFGITRSNAQLLDGIINLIDQWAHHGQMLFTIEQIAASFMLDGKNVREANDCVNHYYAVKRFRHAMFSVFFGREGETYRTELPRLTSQVPGELPKNSLGDRLRIKWVLRSSGSTSRKVAKFYCLGKSAEHCNYLSACRSLWWEKALEEIKLLKQKRSHLARLSSFWATDQAFLAFAASKGELVRV